MLSMMAYGDHHAGAPTDIRDPFREVAALRDDAPDETGDLGPWVLGWGSASVLFSLLLHGPLFFVVSVVLSGAGVIAYLLCGRRRRAEMPQSRAMAVAGLLLALLGIGLAIAGLAGFSPFGLGWSWRAS